MKVTLRNPTRVVEVDGPRRVRDLLGRLGINPDSVLVIRGGDLLAREEDLTPEDEIELRPVVSGGALTKCKRCRAKAVMDVPSANAAFCSGCFLGYVKNKVVRAIEDHEMLMRADRVLVAVSGGKDSLALWDILLDLGYATTGFHLVLGTEEGYARDSLAACERFAAARGADLLTRDLAADDGFTIEGVARQSRRVPCSVCGLAKRYLINAAAVEGGFDVVATGHNLDDEAATLLGNVLHWSTEFLARQRPALPSTHPRLARKVKPLYRVAERESAAYSFLNGIEYVVEECPLVTGNTQLRYKEAIASLERHSPGTRQQFVLGFLDRAASSFVEERGGALADCSVCGMPTPGARECGGPAACAYCRLTRAAERRGRRTEAS
ncbi:MAG: tRNA(Ile)-lysidine synthetase [Acidobacteria bacterium]|nr:tRNA(Ile)-lysidine synthetase [Acidobacteriota bacterium]